MRSGILRGPTATEVVERLYLACQPGRDWNHYIEEWAKVGANLGATEQFKLAGANVDNGF